MSIVLLKLAQLDDLAFSLDVPFPTFARTQADKNVLMLATATLVAGNEPTPNLISESVKPLAEYPDQWAQPIAQPDVCQGHRRGAALRRPGDRLHLDRDGRTELQGQTVRAGERVYPLYRLATA